MPTPERKVPLDAIAENGVLYINAAQVAAMFLQLAGHLNDRPDVQDQMRTLASDITDAAATVL